MPTLYNARVELDTRGDIDDQLLEELTDYGPATGRAERGHVEVYITLPAEGLRQAVTTALALVGSAVGVDVLAVEAMPTDEFDRRVGLAPVPELVGVTDAAAALGVSRQAVLQRLESGSLPGRKVGNAWVIPQVAIERTLPRTTKRPSPSP